MEKMHAAVVSSFAEPPHYREFEVPTPSSDAHALVEVLAVGLHPRVRSGASGTHYTRTGELPRIPGIDGVGRMLDGRLAYFVADDELPGSMAEKTVIDVRRAVFLSDDAQVEKIAAAVNPAMSSWVALRHRVPIEPGQSVLVLGATGNAGTMAVRVAKRLGAGHVVTATVSQRSRVSAPTTSCNSPMTAVPRRRHSQESPRRLTSSSTTCGVNQPNGRSWPFSRLDRTAAAPCTGSRSVRWLVPPWSFRPLRCVQPTSISWATAKAPFRPKAMWRHCPR